MKLLAETEKPVFQKTLAGLSLPSGVDLYMSGGIPTVFKLVSSGRSSGPSEWLHIPLEQLRSLSQRLAVKNENTNPDLISEEPLEIDDGYIFPVLSTGKIRACLRYGGKSCPALSAATQAGLFSVITEMHQSETAQRNRTIREFLGCLFDRDQSVDMFHRSMLNLITSRWPRSLGTIYYFDEGVYRLRLAVGNIHLSDRLGPRLTPEQMRDWEEAIIHERLFIPADMVPEYPTLMDTAPNYLMIHPGIGSDRTDIVTATLISGDIPIEEMTTIVEIARMASYLHESQFSTVSETVSLYGYLGERPASQDSLRKLLDQVFEVVNRQIKLSRLVVGDIDGTASVLTATGSGCSFLSESDPPVPKVVLSELSDDEPLFVDDIHNDNRFSNYISRYLGDNVASEAVFSTGRVDGSDGYISFGLPLSGDHLRCYEPFFTGIARFINLTRQLLSHPDHTAETVGVDHSSDRNRNRLDVIARLAGGYFHDIMECLSVVMGQNELIENAPQNPEIVELGSDRIRKAADKIAAYVDKLRSLCVLTAGQLDSKLSIRRFLKDLPAVVQGYARQIRDNKNVILEIDVDNIGETDFEVSWQELYDLVLPLVLGVMDEAICSGKMTVRMETGRDGPMAVFKIPSAVIGHLTVETLLSGIYVHENLQTNDESSGRLKAGQMIINFECDDEEYYRVSIIPSTTPAGKLNHKMNRGESSR